MVDIIDMYGVTIWKIGVGYELGVWGGFFMQTYNILTHFRKIVSHLKQQNTTREHCCLDLFVWVSDCVLEKSNVYKKKR